MHDLLVAMDGKSHFTKRTDEAKAKLLDVVDQTPVDDLVRQVTKTGITGDVLVHEGDHYALSCKVNKPSSRFDQTMLKNELMKSHGFSGSDAQALIDKCTKQSAAAKRFTIVGR